MIHYLEIDQSYVCMPVHLISRQMKHTEFALIKAYQKRGLSLVSNCNNRTQSHSFCIVIVPLRSAHRPFLSHVAWFIIIHADVFGRLRIHKCLSGQETGLQPADITGLYVTPHSLNIPTSMLESSGYLLYLCSYLMGPVYVSIKRDYVFGQRPKGCMPPLLMFFLQDCTW